MTGIHNQFHNINRDKLTILHAELISGSNTISSYSDFASSYSKTIIDRFSESSLAALDTLLGNLANVAPSARVSLIMAFETAEPALFKALYGDLLTAFYSAPETAERVRQLADAGPRSASPYFEPSLLDRVLTQQSGKRRL